MIVKGQRLIGSGRAVVMVVIRGGTWGAGNSAEIFSDYLLTVGRTVGIMET